MKGFLLFLILLLPEASASAQHDAVKSMYESSWDITKNILWTCAAGAGIDWVYRQTKTALHWAHPKKKKSKTSKKPTETEDIKAEDISDSGIRAIFRMSQALTKKVEELNSSVIGCDQKLDSLDNILRNDHGPTLKLIVTKLKMLEKGEIGLSQLINDDTKRIAVLERRKLVRTDDSE